MEKSEIVSEFESHGADEINTMLGVSAWVPRGSLGPLLAAVPEAEEQYGHETEAFVITE